MKFFIILTILLFSSAVKATDCTPVLRDDGNYEIPTTCIEGYYNENQRVDIEAANKRLQSKYSAEERRKLKERFDKIDKEAEERNRLENNKKLEERIRKLENR